MNVLVTGVTGLVGSMIFEYLGNKEFNIVGTGRKKMDCCENFICADLENDDLYNVFKDYSFDCIVHCAAKIPNKVVTDIECYESNIKLDKKVFEYASKCGSKIIYISSAVLYGMENNDIKTEKSQIYFLSNYHRGKYESEQLLEKSGLDYVCMRIPSPYGHNQTLNTVMKIFIDNLFSKKDLMYFGSGEKTQNFIHVIDIAKAVERAIYSSSIGVYNIASDKAVSMIELASIVQDVFFEVYGYKTNIVYAEKPDPQDHVRINISIEKAKKELDWNPQISIYEGVKDWVLKKEKNEDSSII